MEMMSSGMENQNAMRHPQADEVADASEDQRAEGADQKARRVGAESAEQLEGGVPGGEEEAREEVREDGVEVEVIPLEDRADRGRDDDAPFFRRVDAALDRSN